MLITRCVHLAPAGEHRGGDRLRPERQRRATTERWQPSLRVALRAFARSERHCKLRTFRRAGPWRAAEKRLRQAPKKRGPPLRAALVWEETPITGIDRTA